VADVVELPDRERIRKPPVAAAVEADADAAVVADDDAIRIERVDPHCVVVDVQTARRSGRGGAAVGREVDGRR
jgi:hypothetical protein